MNVKETSISSLLEFHISYVQILDENGQLCTEVPNYLRPKELLELYSRMLLVRAFDQKAVNLQRAGKIGTYPSSLGQEAVSAAIGFSMSKEDVFFPSYRDQGVLFQRGLPIENAFAWWSGDERGNLIEKEYQDFPPCIPVSTQCVHAVGAAYAAKFKQERRAIVVILGDGATSKGDFYEAINLAGVWNLPVVFIINNNRWAISVPLEKQTKCSYLSQKAIAGDIEGITVDGNDIIGLTSVIGESITKAKEQNLPTVIEALTFRLSDHTTADNSTRYRDPQVVKDAWKKEALLRFELFLKKTDILDEETEKKIKEKINKKIEDGMIKFSKFPAQAPTSMVDYLYKTWPDSLIEQREEIKRNASC